jgi:hypothetical protein
MKKIQLKKLLSAASLMLGMGAFILSGCGSSDSSSSATPASASTTATTEATVINASVEGATVELSDTVASIRDVDSTSSGMMALSIEPEAESLCPKISKQVMLKDGTLLPDGQKPKCNQELAKVMVNREWSAGCRMGKGSTRTGTHGDTYYSRPATLHQSVFDITQVSGGGMEWKHKGTMDITPKYGSDGVLTERSIERSVTRSKTSTSGEVYNQGATSRLQLAFQSCTKVTDYCSGTAGAGASFDCSSATVKTSGTIEVAHNKAKLRSLNTLKDVSIGPASGCCYPTSGTVNVKIYKDSDPNVVSKESTITYGSTCGVVTVDGETIELPECEAAQ